MQPSGKLRVPTKGRNLAIKLEEGLLCTILGIFNISGYAETKRIDTPFMKSIEKFEALAVAVLGTFNGFGFWHF
jgi:hypothetical protein